MFLTQRPGPLEIETFLAQAAALPLSYAHIGIAQGAPGGYRLDEAGVVVGHGDAAFSRARGALAAWAHFDLGWVEVFPRGARTEPGAVVAVLVRHLGFWSLNGCRIVYGIDGDSAVREWGFAYGTLTSHAEQGEEIFRVSMRPDSGDVTYSLRAVSKPRALLARAGYPVTRALQARFRGESCRAMRRAVSGGD